MNNQIADKKSDSGFEIKYCHDKINPEWDAFVNDTAGEIYQSSAWANYEFLHHGWKSVRFYIKNEENILAGCQIVIINDELLGDFGVVRSAPCFKMKTPEMMSLVVSEMKKCVQILNLSYLMVSPDHNEHDLVPYLESENFESKFSNLPPYRIQSTYDATLFLDLSLSSEDLLKQMSSMRRRGIQKGLKSPLKVKLGGRDDLKTYYELYHFTATRHKYTDPVTHKIIDCYPSMESYDELSKLWDEMSPSGWVKLFLGSVEDEVVCGALVFPFGKKFRYKNWGWNLKYAEYHVSEVVQWEMIRWAKTNGFQYFDFCEIDATVAHAYLSSESIPEALKETSFYGPTMFKLHFGGNIIKYPGLYVYYSDKMRHLKETSSDELTHLLKLYKDFYWGTKNFFKSQSINLTK